MCFRLSICAALLLWLPISGLGQWQCGVGRADITPTESVPLAGYGGPTRMSQQIDHPIWLKALALRDLSGNDHLLITADLVGLSPKMVDRIAKVAESKFQIPRQRLILNSSHNHSCPITEDVLWLYYELSESEAASRDRYTQMVYDRYEQVMGDALRDLQPAEVAFEQGLAGFAVNRRRSRGPDSRALLGPVDHDVPVLTVTSEGRLRAIVFGYSCHTTALGGLTINGDYAGFAQLALEKSYPEAVAMFVQNCGGDANPLPRIRGRDAPAAALAQKYGDILAEAVRQVVDSPRILLEGPIDSFIQEIELTLQPGFSLEELQQQVTMAHGMHQRELQYWIMQYQQFGSLPGKVQYPVQLWRLGRQLDFIALTGETVVDYSLTLKHRYGWNRTWVSGYNDDLLSYVPSRRVLLEGGYEGTSGMAEYGHRAPYTEDIEAKILHAVEQLQQK